MPILSDFTVVNSGISTFNQSTRAIEFPFSTGGRHNSDAFLDLSLSPRDAAAGDTIMNLSVAIKQNRANVTGPSKPLTIKRNPSDEGGRAAGMQRYIVVIPPGELSSRSGDDNTLIIRPSWEPPRSPNDRLTIGPIICHFHQSD